MKVHYIQNDPQVGPGKIEIWASQRGYTLTSTKVYEKCDFPPLNEVDFLIVLGGPMGTYEEETYSWLSLEKQFIREAVENNKFVLGICLGAQLIANALGGKVYPHTHKEVGWWPVEQNKEAINVELTCGLFEKFTALHFHGDTFDLPEEAILIASSKGCKNQLFIYKDYVIGIQFHPEMTNQQIDNTLKNYEIGEGEFVQKPENIVNQFALLQESTDMLFRLLDNIENKYKKKEGKLLSF
ncbi:type 1 glutamine amidotransferase [Peribacillus frigoritolerans]|uniref:type 1 glutamine amidotransferase n=1 Tax=Peribacillus frigoritolerans TaxID=450367 RepID=UPI00227FF560|nr:type 1 glutamine amidotransferase [Peribacillus frigoritolerans]MCY9002438.1 type 1 glutamine amidotransferase [Peribacillus frigoritolerans]